MSLAKHLAPDLSTAPDSEQRRKARVTVPFPARVRGVDARGREFEVVTVLDNLSQDGLHVHLPHQVEKGMRIFVVFQLSTSPVEETATRVAVRGVVLRVEPRPPSLWGIAVAITSHRFL